MKKILSTFLFFSLSVVCFAEEKLPVAFPLELSGCEFNREYVKDQRQVVSYKSKLNYADACTELSRVLGEGWKKKESTEEEQAAKQKLLLDPAVPFAGLDTYINDQYPDITLTIALVHSSVRGTDYPYFLTLTIGPLPAE